MQWEDRIARRIRLKDLHTLQAIASEGSMAKASAKLALSQPAVSKAIAELEDTLGASLLDRSSRGVELTGPGRLLLEHGRVIFDELRVAGAEIRRLSDPARGNVRVGTTEPLTGVVADIICHLLATHPLMTFEVTVTDTDTLVRMLRERTIDAAITRWEASAVSDDLSAQPLYRSVLAVMASRDHPLARRRRLRLDSLAGERWTLSPPDSFLGRLVVDLFRANGLELPHAIVTTPSIYMRLGLLSSGRFLTVLPTASLTNPMNRPWLRALDVDAFARQPAPISMIVARERRQPGAVQLFQQAGRDVCARIDFERIHAGPSGRDPSARSGQPQRPARSRASAKRSVRT